MLTDDYGRIGNELRLLPQRDKTFKVTRESFDYFMLQRRTLNQKMISYDAVENWEPYPLLHWEDLEVYAKLD